MLSGGELSSKGCVKENWQGPNFVVYMEANKGSKCNLLRGKAKFYGSNWFDLNCPHLVSEFTFVQNFYICSWENLFWVMYPFGVSY